MVVAPFTSKVPRISVFPLSVSTVNLLTPPAVWIATTLLSALTVKPSVIVVRLSTSSAVSYTHLTLPTSRSV